MAVKTVNKVAVERGSGIRRLRPRALPPLSAAVRGLTPEDSELLAVRLREPAECIFHPRFRLKSSVSAATPVVIPKAQPIPVPGVPTEVLSAEEERDLFFRFNLYRFRVMRVLRAYSGRRLDRRAVRELLRWEKAALTTRDAIAQANTSLVLAMARRARNATVELADLVSEGNLALVRCVDKFDFSRGFKFSTYACRAILASFSRASAKQSRYRMQFPAPYDPALERSDYLEKRRIQSEVETVDDLKGILHSNAAELSVVERRVLDARFGLDDLPSSITEGRGKTLEQVGSLLGVSKERVRQIQNHALAKLRSVLEDRLPAAS